MVVERHRLDPKRCSELAHTKTFQPLLINQAQGYFQHSLPCERLTRFRHDPRPPYTYIVSLQCKYKAEKEGYQEIHFQYLLVSLTRCVIHGADSTTSIQ